MSHPRFKTVALIALIVALLLTACGERELPGGDNSSSGESTTTTAAASTTSAATTTPVDDGLTDAQRAEVQALVDEGIEDALKDFRKEVKGMLEPYITLDELQGELAEYVRKDELEELVDERFAALVAEYGLVSADQLQVLREELLAAGVPAEEAEAAVETLVPADSAPPGDPGANHCSNRQTTDWSRVLLDTGRELKLADSTNPGGVPADRQSFANWVETDLASVEALLKARYGNAAYLREATGSEWFREYWCAGTDADGAIRSGVNRHQMRFQAGKLMYDLGNGVVSEKDCGNLAARIEVPEPEQLPTTGGTTPGTSPEPTRPSVPPTPPTTGPCADGKCEEAVPVTVAPAPPTSEPPPPTPELTTPGSPTTVQAGPGAGNTSVPPTTEAPEHPPETTATPTTNPPARPV